MGLGIPLADAVSQTSHAAASCHILATASSGLLAQVSAPLPRRISA
jgi:hypothetical protein